MFYKILFLLACYNLYKSVKGFYNEHVIIKEAGLAELSTKVYVEAALTVLCYVMVMAICILPSILF